MAANPSSSPVSLEEYLGLERSADQKHEYDRGEIFDMAGGSPRHALLAANVLVALGRRLEGTRCNAFGSDLRVCVLPFMVVYPDATVICGEPTYTDERRDTITNPAVLVEILSPSTEKYDRSVKARRYREAPSVQEFLLLDQDSVDVEHYRRLPNGHWEIAGYRHRDAVIQLKSIGCELTLDEVYRGAELFGALG